MTQFLLCVHHDYSEPLLAEGDDPNARIAAVSELNLALQAAGAWVFAGGLQPPDAAKVVDASDGEAASDAVTTEGPFAQARERIDGMWVIEAPDEESALEWARKASIACVAPVECRPFQEG